VFYEELVWFKLDRLKIFFDNSSSVIIDLTRVEMITKHIKKHCIVCIDKINRYLVEQPAYQETL